MKNLFLWLLLLPNLVISQQENNWWFFGYNAGIEFTSGMPVAVRGDLTTIEGCSSLSDRLGNLIMYSNGSSIWDRNGNLMPGADNTLDGGGSSAQSGFIYRDEANPNIAIVFTVGNGSGGVSLKYTLVDLLANSGLGDVIPGRLNIPLINNTHEKVTGFYDPMSSKSWILTYRTGEIYAFEINGTVVSGVPVISSLPSTSILTDLRGPMKISPDGTKVAFVSTSNGAFVADFDVSTGIASNPVQLRNNGSTFTTFYGLEFSPDSRFIYLDANTTQTGNGCGLSNQKQFLQYDLTRANFSSVPLVINSSPLTGGRSGMQIGPDGKIYVARTCNNFIAVIENPTVAGTACRFVDNAITLLPNTECREALPNNLVTSLDGQFNTITGTVAFDNDNNGCDPADPAYNNVLITSIDNTGNPNLGYVNNGRYELQVGNGDYTITPIMQNSSLWTITPSSQTVSFPTANSPYSLDFCVVANGSVTDDKVQLTALNQAIPGTIGRYKIRYENQGNQASSGTIELNYDDSVMTFDSASGTGQSLSGGIVRWTYSNLQPLAAGEHTVSFVMNRPTDTPPLNSGDILNFSATTTTLAADADLTNNSSNLLQRVVNSYDPNDIVCHEGELIPLNMIGKRIDYTVRFENLGTAAARNIVIRLDVDESRLDISSIRLEGSSHISEMRKNRQGEVEFLFRDINLDFNDATNDGFITYSINTLNSLSAGDQISQQAAIYFDYNLPIFTNTYVTTVDATAGSQRAKIDSIRLFPVPATDLINVSTDREIKNIEIFTMSGQMLLREAQITLGSRINISSLSAGSYVIRVHFARGSVNKVFVKR